MIGSNSDSVFWASRTARWSWTNAGSARRARTSSYLRRISSSFSNMVRALSRQLPAVGQTDVRTEPLESGEGRGRGRRGASPRRPLGRGAGGLLLVALAEALDAAGRVHELLLAGEEGVALAADLDAQLLLRGAGRPGLAAGAVDQDLVIARGAGSVFMERRILRSRGPGRKPAVRRDPPAVRSRPERPRVRIPEF